MTLLNDKKNLPNRLKRILTLFDSEDGKQVVGASISKAASQRVVDCWNACEGIPDPSVVPALLASACYFLGQSSHLFPWEKGYKCSRCSLCEFATLVHEMAPEHPGWKGHRS